MIAGVALILAANLALIAEEGGGFKLFDFNDWTLSLWTLVIFGISLPLMWKFVFKPISEALEARDKKAEDAVTSAQAAQKAAQEAKAACDAQLANVRVEAAKALSEASAKAEARGKEILAQAQAEASKNLERARQEIEREKMKALSEIRDEVVGLTLMAAEKVISRKITDEDSKKFVRDMISESAKA